MTKTLVDNVLMSGVIPSLAFERITNGRVLAPGPLVKVAVARYSRITAISRRR